MRATGSIRTATRWPFSDGARALARAGTVVALLLVAGCVTRTTTYYVPTPGEARLSVDDLRDQSDRMLGVECPRLMQAAHDSAAVGEATIALDVARSGDVVRAAIDHSSGDAQLDRIFGALAARLHLEAASPPKADTSRALIHVGYACGPNTAATTVRY